MDAAVDRPAPPRAAPVAALVVSVFAISWAAPLRRLTDAPSLALSFWRLAFSFVLVAGVLAFRSERSDLRRLSAGEWLVAGGAGALLALHFATWFASLELTSVAASVSLVNLQPVMVAVLSAALLAERPSGRQWVGIAVAVGGAVVIGVGDSGAGGSVRGDLLAVIAASFFALYYIVGRVLRKRVAIWPYVTVVYGAAAGVLLLLALGQGVPLVRGYGRSDWLVFAAEAAGPMFVGHTGQNWALRFLPAYVVSLFLLGETPGSTLLAWLLPGVSEVPPVQALAGGSLILMGILIGMRRR